MNRDWKNFFKSSLKSLRSSALALLLVPIFYLMLNPQMNWSGFAMSVRIGLIVVIINYLFVIALRAAILILNPKYLDRIRDSVQVRFLMGFIGMMLGLITASWIEPMMSGNHLEIQGITTGLLIGSITYLLFLFLAAYRQSQSQYLKLQAESAVSSLHVLKNQMQPHFLFNSLNSLAELIDSNHEQAAVMTQKLSDLYRQILDASKENMSNLADEVSISQNYLELEKLRFSNRLDYEVSVPENSRNIILPSLILQTLVENSVKHGISNCLNGGKITLNVVDSRNGYLVKIKNTSREKRYEATSKGTGLNNTRRRLDLIYGKQHGFNMQFDSTNTVVTFWISGV